MCTLKTGPLVMLIAIGVVACAVAWHGWQIAGLRAASVHAGDPTPDATLVLEKSASATDELEMLSQECARLEAQLAAANASLPKKPRVRARSNDHWQLTPRYNPADTLRSVVWAALAGETEQLAAMLTLSPEGRSEAESFFARQPPEVQTELKSPDGALATVLSAQMPPSLKRSQLKTSHAEPDGTEVATFILDAGKTQREVTFRFKRDGVVCKLEVPVSQVVRIGQMLTDE